MAGRTPLLIAWSCLLVTLATCETSAAEIAKTAARIDELLAADRYGASDSTETVAPESLVDDATFLRRVSLDILGVPSTAAETARFVLDPATDKRTKIVEHLLADPRYGENWARYWRDVIYMRRSDDRALFGEQATTQFLTDAFNQGQRWNEIAHQFVTATGDASEHGECGIILAQMADPSNVTAEISRIFMGVQIQCAQCHNHPFDRWKREQFHEMAAFFPRIGIRRSPKNEGRSFKVVSLRRPIKKRSPADTEGAKLEHYMPDLEDPEAEGTLMKPVFYATAQKMDLGVSDETRRKQLAKWMTSRGNHWFDKAFVNRIWGEMIGRGFQEPLDDLGPDRKPSAPKTFEYLSREFAASGYDHKWLMQVITATKLYQMQSRVRTDSTPAMFAASCTQRLRGDQLYNALTQALGIQDFDRQARRGRGTQGPQAALRSPRGQLNQVFAYDPSDRRDEITSSIPQVLFLMNAPEVNRFVSAQNFRGALAQLLEREQDNTTVVEELYLRTLSREPRPAEVEKCIAYVKDAANRAAAFEDIQWALINSTEFLYRK